MGSVSPRIRPGPDRTKRLLLSAAERVMLADGYGAMTARRVAEEAGCAPSLIFHYFQTVDGLIIALYRRSAERELKRLNKLVKQDRPLAEFWNPNIDVALAAEFQAMAAHNEVLNDELARHAQTKRTLLEKAVDAALLRAKLDTKKFPPAGVAFLFSAIFRAFLMESAGGFDRGHAEALAIINDLLGDFDKRDLPDILP